VIGPAVAMTDGRARTLVRMGFRVVVTGVRHFADYPRLRGLLDRLLVHRLPDVVTLSGCGRGTPSRPRVGW